MERLLPLQLRLLMMGLAHGPLPDQQPSTSAVRGRLTPGRPLTPTSLKLRIYES